MQSDLFSGVRGCPRWPCLKTKYLHVAEVSFLLSHKILIDMKDIAVCLNADNLDRHSLRHRVFPLVLRSISTFCSSKSSKNETLMAQ